MDRHLRLAFLVCLPLEVVVAVAAGFWNWDERVVWTCFVLIVMLGMAISYRGFPKPPPRR